MGIFFISIFITTLVAFVLAYLLFRRGPVNPTKRPKFWLIFAVMIPVLYMAGLFIKYQMDASYERVPFKTIEWQAKEDSRYTMVKDLIDKKYLLGKKPHEVQVLLGMPEEIADTTLVYYIGYDPVVFMNNDPDWLILHLNEGVVSECLIQR